MTSPGKFEHRKVKPPDTIGPDEILLRVKRIGLLPLILSSRDMSIVLSLRLSEKM